MYLGDLGQGSTGERFRIIGQKGGRRLSCPPGTTTESSGKLGTGQDYVWCYRAPSFAPPPVTQTTISVPTTVSVPTQVATQVSPQISPTLAQQQASPGAGVTSAPGQQAAGPSTSQGISAGELRNILEAQEAARAAERQAAERKQTAEMEELRRQMSERERASQDIYLAEQKAAADRAEAERFAREQAEALQASLAPPPPSMAPSAGGGLPAMFAPPSQEIAAPIQTQARDVSVTADAGGAPPWALLLLAAAGVGAVVMMGAKGGKSRRKSRAKK